MAAGAIIQKYKIYSYALQPSHKMAKHRTGNLNICPLLSIAMARARNPSIP